jgi:Flp pilus assembly protein TadD
MGTRWVIKKAVEQMFQFASNRVAVSTAVSPDLKQQVFAAHESAGNDLLAARPNDARLELFMGVFYGQFGQNDQSLKFLQKAASDSPSKQQILFQTGITALQRGDAMLGGSQCSRRHMT